MSDRCGLVDVLDRSIGQLHSRSGKKNWYLESLVLERDCWGKVCSVDGHRLGKSCEV